MAKNDPCMYLVKLIVGDPHESDGQHKHSESNLARHDVEA